MDCVKVYDSEIVIQLTDYIKHDGYVHHLHELYRTLHQLRSEIATKRIRFLSVETEPFRMIAFDRVLEYVATAFDLQPDRLILDCYDHIPRFETPWATLSVRPSTSWSKPITDVEVDKCVIDHDTKLFGGFFGRFTIHRFLMAHYLETIMADHSVVVFHPTVEWSEYECNSVMKYYEKEFEWLRSRQANRSNLQGGYNGRVDDFRSLHDYHNIYGSHDIEVVIETNVYDCGWFTEKTAKCLYTGKPFILFGVAGQIQQLHELGFKTFSPYINESYDKETNSDKRFDMIKKEIERISLLPASAQKALVKAINNIAQYNKENYKLLIKDYFDQYDYNH